MDSPAFARFPFTARLLQADLAAGQHLGGQLFLRREGEIVLDAAWGEAREGIPARPDTLFTWLSASKPIAAIGIARLWEADRLTLDQRVADFIPEFAQGGKEALTLAHLLTHTGGFRSADAVWNNATAAENLARAIAAPLEEGWVPGETAGYQMSASWYILGEVIRRLTGKPFEQWAREEIFLPLGMNHSWFAAPPEVYRGYGDRIGFLHNTALGRRDAHRFWDTEAAYGECVPGATGHGPVRELAHIYEMLAGGGEREGVRLLRPETVAHFTTRHRVGRFDLTFQHIVDWGLGIIVNSNRYGARTVPYGFGPHASEATFGHSGAQSSCAYYDPAQRLVAAWVLNGMPGEAPHRRRARDLNAALYEDLGLAVADAPTS